MIFSSVEFLFAFLPVTFAGFFILASFGTSHRLAVLWLTFASLVFYMWWNPWYVILLLGSVGGNFALGWIMARHPSKVLLACGVAANLGLLGYYKYTNFFLDFASQALGESLRVEGIVLPLAISFFTFQQIAYLFDVHQGKARSFDFVDYTLFVTFFPQLIAGPIVHYSETIPQIERESTFHINWSNIRVGLAILTIGLYKKLVFADGMEPYATEVFSTAAETPPMLLEAWVGSLAYTFQIYFDFSGYSDMAIGLARLFGIRLPINFDSPYKANSIIEFWRRWHITLSRFLRDYLYIPLGGNRLGSSRRYVNLMATMLLGGLWHGAAWTFVVWGGLHGLFLMVNHYWNFLKRPREKPGFAQRAFGRALTFLCVVIAWVVFRAETFPEAIAVLSGMAGLNGVETLSRLPAATPWIGALLAIVWFAPSTQEWMSRSGPALGYEVSEPKMVGMALGKGRLSGMRRAAVWLCLLSLGAVSALIAFEKGTDPSTFIYMIF